LKVRYQQMLAVYSAILSATFAVVLLTGAKSTNMKSFDRIQVRRIDVVESDGTLRMVITNHDQMPGVIIKGKENPKVDRPQAGLLFFNDEGTENGGLIFGGHRDQKGDVVDSGGSLSFDKYGASQIVQLVGVDDKEDHFAGLAVSDQSSRMNRRIWVGRQDNGASVVALMDAMGRKRIVMQVAADGTASLDFLGTDGHVIKSLIPTNP
jgi:hypothetical protein